MAQLETPTSSGAVFHPADPVAASDEVSDHAGLTEPQIEDLVNQYRREMARYEKAGNLVGERLRRELRDMGIKHMVSSRPKHPEDLANKLRKKAKEKPSIYSWKELNKNLGSVVTDLSGCRVVVYSADDEKEVGDLVDGLFIKPSRTDACVSRRRSYNQAYWATHALVYPYSLGDAPDATVDETICELQIVTSAAHLFNEIEHDIIYKDRDEGLKPDDHERQLVDELRGVARIADRLVGELLKLRARRRHEGATVIDSIEALRFTLSNQAGRQIQGPELGLLLSLLNQLISPLTPAAVRALGEIDKLIYAGRLRLNGATTGYPETILYAVGLTERFEPEIRATVKSWAGPHTAMRRALTAALRERT